MGERKLRERLATKPFAPVTKLDTETGEIITVKHLLQERLEQCLSVDNVELDLNECWLWHATSQESAETIASKGFQVSQAGAAASGLRYGSGAYFAESLEKALAYSIEEAGAKCIVLCRVALGDIHFTEKDTENSAANA